MDGFLIESLPNTVVSNVILHFLNLSDYAKLDCAICSINRKFLLAQKLSNSGSSNWFPICFDLTKPDQNKQTLKWFSDKRIVKHQNIEIYNMSLVLPANTLIDLLGCLDIRSVLSLSLHCCDPGIKTSRWCLVDNLEPFHSLVVLCFVKCTILSDEHIVVLTKQMPQLEVMVKTVSSSNNVVPGRPRKVELSVQTIVTEESLSTFCFSPSKKSVMVW